MTRKRHHPPAADRDLVRRTVRAAWWNTIVTPLSSLVSILGSFWIIRSLEKSDFGLYALAIASAAGLSTLADLGSSRAAARLYPDLRRHRGKPGVIRLLVLQYGVKIVMLGVLAVVWALRSDWVTGLLRFGSRSAVPAEMPAGVALLVFVMAFADSARDSLHACFSGLLEQKPPTLAHFAYSVARPLLVVILYRVHGISGALTGLALGAVFRIVLLLPPLIRWKGPPGDGLDVGHVGKRMVRLSAMSYVDKVGVFLTGPAFLILAVSSQWTRPEIGEAWAALDIVIRGLTFAMAVTNGILVPMFAEVAGDANLRQRRMAFSLTVRIHAALTLTAGAALAAGVARAFPMITRPEYAEAGVWAAWAAPLLALYYAFFPSANAVLMVAERFRVYAASRTVCLLAVPVFHAAGLRGPAAGVLAVGLLRCAAAASSQITVHLAEGLRAPWGRILRFATVWVGVMALFHWGIPGDWWWGIRMVLAAGMTIVGGFAAGTFSRREMRMMRDYALPGRDRGKRGRG